MPNRMTKASTMSALRSCRFFLLVSAGMLLPCAMRAQQPGTLDTTFAGDGALGVSLATMGGDSQVVNLRLITFDDSLTAYFVTHSWGSLRFLSVRSDASLDSMPSPPVSAAEIAAAHALTNVRFLMACPHGPEVYVQLQSDAGMHFLHFDAAHQLDLGFGQGGLLHDSAWLRFTDQTIDGFKKLHHGGGLIWGRYSLPSPSGDLAYTYAMLLDDAFLPDSTFGENGVVSWPPWQNLFGFVTSRIRFVEEMTDGKLVLGNQFEGFISPWQVGASGVCVIDRAGTTLDSFNTNPNCANPGGEAAFNAMHVTVDGVMAGAVGSFCGRLTTKRIGTPLQYSQSVWPGYAAVRCMTSDIENRLYITGASWEIGRRFENGARDETFGLVLDSADLPASRMAEVPEGGLQVSGVAVMPDGRLLAWGRGASDEERLIVARYHNMPDPRARLRARIFLGGAYDSSTGLMRDDLRQQSLVPMGQPYAGPGFVAVNGVGQTNAPMSLLAHSGDDAVVDWTWLELLDAADGSTVVATRVGLLHRNGWVTAPDGHADIDFLVGAGNYYVRARHRNHLSAMSAQPVTLGASLSTLDFTDAATATFGSSAQMEADGMRMLWPGDANSNGAVKYVGAGNDRDAVLLAIGATNVIDSVIGYLSEDTNCDGVVRYVGAANDRDVILQALEGDHLMVRHEQLP